MNSKDSIKLEEANKTSHVSLDIISNPSTTTNLQPDHASSSLHTFKFWDEGIYMIQLMSKVNAFVRDKYNSDDYDPLVVSFGPYHHDHPRLQFVEELKPEIWKLFVSNTGLHEKELLKEVHKVIDDLRGSYAKGSTKMYNDNVFARMMLQDAAFIVEYISQHNQDSPDNTATIFDNLFGTGILEHVTRDLFVLENQVPFWFLKIMFHIRCGKREGDKLLKNFLNWSSFRSIEVDDQPIEPHHLVRAVRTVVIAGWSSFGKNRIHDGEHDGITKGPTTHDHYVRAAAGGGSLVPEVPQVEGSSSISKLIHSFHSVTELKAKGIHISRNVTNSLKDVSFRSGFFFSTLQLPAAMATVRIRSVYSNIIAYEMSEENYMKDYTVTAYVSFMKSLMESPKDVKELQDKGVIKNMLGSDEEVVKLYKDIYTFGIDSSKVYRDVVEEIQKHYNSRRRTWIADLLYTYFRSPWTAIALLGSILVIALTMAQTYYAAHPKDNK